MSLVADLLCAIPGRVAAWIRSPVTAIGIALRDPLYRYELRQQNWWRTPVGILAGLVLLLPGVYCCLIGIIIYTIPAVLAADGLLSERDRGTLEDMLITPMGRLRWLWAKLLARLRGLLMVFLALPLIGALAGLIIGIFASPEDTVLPPLIGLGIGLAMTVYLTPSLVSAGAIGLAAALYGRTRGKSMLFAYLFAGLLYIADQMLFGAACMCWAFAIIMSMDHPVGEGLIPATFVPWLFIVLGTLTLLVLFLRAVLYLGTIPGWLLRWAAQNLDEKLLADN
ncbi:MAG TPA: hypothetical protein PK280_13820 [Planctomycetota bacterium]|nr:hypothetical protein [Planctomycetota bacterium]